MPQDALKLCACHMARRRHPLFHLKPLSFGRDMHNASEAGNLRRRQGQPIRVDREHGSPPRQICSGISCIDCCGPRHRRAQTRYGGRNARCCRRK